MKAIREQTRKQWKTIKLFGSNYARDLLSAKLPNKILNKIFAVMLILVAIYIIYDFMKSFY